MHTFNHVSTSIHRTLLNQMMEAKTATAQKKYLQGVVALVTQTGDEAAMFSGCFRRKLSLEDRQKRLTSTEPASASPHQEARPILGRQTSTRSASGAGKRYQGIGQERDGDRDKCSSDAPPLAAREEKPIKRGSPPEGRHYKESTCGHVNRHVSQKA